MAAGESARLPAALDGETWHPAIAAPGWPANGARASAALDGETRHTAIAVLATLANGERARSTRRDITGGVTRWRSALVVCAALFASTAFAQVPPGGGSQPGDLDGGTPIADVITCQACHDHNVSADTTRYAPWDGWVTSMMGNAARDPLYRAALTVANQDVPGVGTFCLRCHSPQSYVRGHATPADGSAFDEVDVQGVDCEVCHRSVPGPDGGFLLGNAQLYWDRTGYKHGPYENVVSPAHDGEQSAYTSSSALCGQCHQVENPLVEWRAEDGGTRGRPFPLDTTYEEWAQSDFAKPDGKGCVECHMPAYAGAHPVASLGPERTDPRRHVFVGGNVWGVAMIQKSDPDLAFYFSKEFAETQAQARQLLASAAELKLSAPGHACDGEAVDVTVSVRNLTGHKLPTGYGDARRIWIELSFRDEVRVGALDPVTGALVEDPQLRVYEAHHGRFGIGPGHHLALHDTIFSDTRIPPAGFVPTEATRPVGTTWFDDGDGGYLDRDVATFHVTVTGASGPLRARLLYQPTTAEYVDALAGANSTDSTGQTLKTLFEQTGRAEPIEMARAEAPLSVLACNEATPGDGGTIADAGAGTNGGGSGNAPGGCGCAGGGGAIAFLAALLSLLFLSHRERSSPVVREPGKH